MMTADEEFLEELRAAFQIEASEHLQSIGAGLLEIEKAPTTAPPSLIETICRDAHSLKGAARAVDAIAIERICQPLEDVFSAWKYGELAPSPEQFTPIYKALDAIEGLLDKPMTGEIAADVSPVIKQIQSIKNGTLAAPAPTFEVPSEETESEPFEKPVEETIALHESATEAELSPEEVTVAPVKLALASPLAAERMEKKPPPETVRISTRKLDRLLLQAEEMLMVKLTAQERAAALHSLEGTLEPWDKEWRKLSPALRHTRRSLESGEVEQSAAAPLGKLLEFLEWNHAHVKALETRLIALSKASEQDSRIVSSLVNNLLEDTKKLLMLPFATLFRLFPKMVRDLAHDQNKNVQLVLEGSEIEIDKRILEGMKDPLIHLLRNSVDHGIEAPQEREKNGKPAQATLTIAVSRLGSSEVQILIADDGAGLNVAKIKSVAMKQGLISAEAAEKMTDAQVAPLIFQSGFSTSSIITSISGRGLGMAIVREQVEKLGGRLSVETKSGAGTEFHIILPLALAAFKGILVRVAEQIFVIPTADVERVVRIRPDEILTVENRETIALSRAPSGHDIVSLARLGEVLELSRHSAPQNEGFLQAVVLGAREKRIAFIVDEVLNEQEVLVKTLGEPLIRVRNVAGATVLGSGRAVPILNAADLLKSAQRTRAPFTSNVAQDVAKTAHKAVLVVEDSITSRMLLKNILESSGYRVTTAVDGLDGLTALKTEEFDAVISDVDMPRMNGFELTAAIRAEQKWTAMPVVLVTARDSREDRERGVDAGANAYLVKSNFDQSNLLSVLQRLI